MLEVHPDPNRGVSQSVKIRGDNAPLLSALADLTDLDVPDVRQRLFSLSQLASELVRFKIDVGSALGANEMVVTFQPSDALRDLLAAARAGNGDLCVVKEALGHGA